MSWFRDNQGRLEQLLETFYVSRHQNGDNEILCNFCDEFLGDGLDYVMLDAALAHVETTHPGNLKDPVDPVTDEEVAEVFGVSPRR